MEVNDVVYGKICLPSNIAAIVETPLFKRLKCLKQLGFIKLDNFREYEHNRYNHCIGTYHAAGLMLDALEKNTPSINRNNNQIPELYRQSVKVAALLHDLGHGPFSHTWEWVIGSYKHERVSVACVDTIFSTIDANLFPELRANNNYGIKLIKALIKGDKSDIELPTEYHFIFQIVCNANTNLDVDKWDYLKRDRYYLKDLCDPNMDIDDVLLKARASECGQHIEYRFKDYNKICNIFAARWHFHKYCYRRPDLVICDEIFKIGIKETNPLINGHQLSAIDAEQDMASFLQLTDDQVLALIDDHPLREFLKYKTKFQLVKEEEMSSKQGIFKCLISIPNIDNFIMNSKIRFYGDVKEKPAYINKTHSVNDCVTFYCDKSKKTVFYYVKPAE